jgi:hypothetical protein
MGLSYGESGNQAFGEKPGIVAVKNVNDVTSGKL